MVRVFKVGVVMGSSVLELGCLGCSSVRVF